MSDEIKISPEDIEHIRYLISSPAWKNFFKPSLENLRDGWVETLISPAQERKNKTPDDFIRGCLSTLNAFMRLPEEVIAEYDTAVQKQLEEKRAAAAYEQRARDGRIGPY